MEESKNNDDDMSEQQTGLDELDKVISADVENTISDMRSEYEELVAEIDTYEKYLKNTDKVKAYYNQVYENTKDSCIRMREYSINYAEKIMASDKSNDEKNDDFEELYDCIYDDAGDDIYDEIYEDILDDIYDAFYGGILEDAYDQDVVYEEWSDMIGELWDDDTERAEEKIADFREDIEKLKSKGTQNDTQALNEENDNHDISKEAENNDE